jgi:cathepsin B
LRCPSGSCWAFGSTESFEDRRCISTGEDILFSTEDTLSCCGGMMMGCNGGNPSASWGWFASTGVVTGGDFGGGGCQPYNFPPCSHHVNATKQYPECPHPEYHTPRCERTCNASYNQSYSQDKTKASKSYSVRGVAQIQTELMTHGPLAVAFRVFADFLTYKSGVYKHTTGSELGGHAVEMVGWGVEDGQDYWLIKNSWNPSWGDGGFFKIAKGVSPSECGIEDMVTGGTFSA